MEVVILVEEKVALQFGLWLYLKGCQILNLERTPIEKSWESDTLKKGQFL